MNPLFAQFRAYDCALPTFDLVEPSENPATAHDRAYIAANVPDVTDNKELLAYDRAPIADEWTEAMPQGAYVRVFVINECTTVRVLHNACGDRVAEPVIDSWRGDATSVLAA